MQIITKAGSVSSIGMTSDHPDFGTAYAVVKRYDVAGGSTTNIEIVVRRPSGAQALVFAVVENTLKDYGVGVPIIIGGKAGPSSVGWRANGDLEVAANIRQEDPHRQAWARLVLRCGDDGRWGEV